MTKLLLVGAGGFLGSIVRALISNFIQQQSASQFPLGTLTVNVIGCFVIGFLAQLGDTHDYFTAEARSFIFIGILGGFTTYSSFGNETINLWRAGTGWIALGNVLAQLLLGLGGVMLGRWVATRF